MMLSRLLFCCGLLCAWLSPLSQVAGQGKLETKPGDVWVMAGDSITAQRLHSNYIEAYYRTRYPSANLQFRNSGIGGNTTGSVLARFDYDIAAFKPTIVSIELGMNDVGRGPDPTGYIAGMQKLIDQIRAIKATPVLISSSPVNDGSKLNDWKGDRCKNIHPYTEALVKFGAEQKVIVVDQYHTLLDLWGKNKAAEKDQINLTGDPVHPGAIGQFTMAAVILDKLDVEREVSSATLKADGTVVEAKSCQITKAAASNGGLSFTRLDERSVWPIPANCRDALKLLPSIADLSRYTLKVTDLPAGNYSVTMNGTEVAQLTQAQLAAGYNLSTVSAGPFAERAAKITDLIGKLQRDLNNNWRAASKAKDAEKLAEAQAAIDAAEKVLQEACKPTEIAFEVRLVK